MDIKFRSIQAVFFIAILAFTFETTFGASHRGRGNWRVTPRRHNRREVRDYLAPPAQDASYTSYGAPPLQSPSIIPYRPGRRLNSPPTTEAPGYFSRIASWLNPFGGSPEPPPLPETPLYPNNYGQLQPPPQSYGPPVPPPPPVGSHGYLPPNGKGKNCNPCNSVPWIPLPGLAQNDVYGAGTTNVENQPSNNQEAKNQGGSFAWSNAEEVRTSDFGYGPLANSHRPQHLPPPNVASYGSPGPIPYPHLYPGPMPPLFKAKPFIIPPENLPPSIGLSPGPFNAGDSLLSIPGPVNPNLADGHVEVLPPGAEVDTSGIDGPPPTGFEGEIRDTPPPGYEESLGLGHHGDSYGSTSLNIQQSEPVLEQHLSTELTVGYGVQAPGNVEVVKSVPAAEFTASIEHPIHFEQSPLIDLSQQGGKQAQNSHQEQGNGGSNYASGLNPPPNVAPESYDQNGGSVGQEVSKNPPSGGSEQLKNSYGNPVGQESPKDSLVASTAANETFSHPTSGFGIPDVGELPISHESSSRPTVYENYPPSSEKFLISVKDPAKNSRGPLVDGAQNIGDQESTGSLLQEHKELEHNQHGKIVDSYQRHIDQNHPQNRPAGFLSQPEPLVPYRPSSLYIPYPPYTGPSGQQDGQSSIPASQLPPLSTTEEPFLEALLKSYDNFKQEMAANDQLAKDQQDRLRAESQINQDFRNPGSPGGTTWVSQPLPSFPIPERINPAVYSSGNLMPPPASSSETQQQRQSGTKKNKQVQIIIPYTSQYTPSPFQPVTDDWSGRGPLEQTQARKVPDADISDHNYVGQESKNVEITRTLRPLENLLSKEVAKKPTSAKQTNNSIDVSRLQKNIDNWTIQEYSRGITSSTALPSSSHPYLLPSKIIPHEYLTSTPSSASKEKIDGIQSEIPGFNYNDLEHEVAASSRVDAPRVQVLRVEGAPKAEDNKEGSQPTSPQPPSSTSSSSSSSSSTTTSTTEESWAELPVSISPHSNERVYVVTPQPVRPSKSWGQLGDVNKTGKLEAIERAYQVLPQAVNNLASSSVSGPENSPLWGIMEHDDFAKNNQENSTTSKPILYSGQSKVSTGRR